MNPYDPGELGVHDPELDRIAHELEREATAIGGEPPLSLTGRILTAIDQEPMPAARWAWLANLRGPARMLAAAAVVVVAITGALAIGSLINGLGPDVGGPPTPVVLPSPSASPSPSATPSPSPSPTIAPSVSASGSPSPTATPVVQATPSDDDDEVETPEPSESDDDNSGPGGGGGGDDNSGPGGGGGDG
jgi:hypothetical protein